MTSTSSVDMMASDARSSLQTSHTATGNKSGGLGRAVTGYREFTNLKEYCFV